MKKSFSLVIAILILLASASALSETFSVHSGVQFGMTMDEVIQKEIDAGFTDAKITELEEVEIFCCPDDHDTRGVSVNGQIAGVKGANIKYHFLKNGGMDAAVYTLGFSSSGGTYESIRESLIKKYGEPEPEMSSIWTTYLDMTVYSYGEYFVNQFNNPSIGFVCKVEYLYEDSWLIPQDDGSYVMISGCEFALYIKSPYSSDNRIATFVGYQHFSKEEIAKALANAAEAVNTYHNQLENDL